MLKQRKAIKKKHHDGPAALPANLAENALARLSRGLREDGIVQFFLNLFNQFPDEHLKDLVAQEMDPQRRIRFGDHTVVNFGSDSFLGLDQDPRVQDAIARGLKTWGTHNGSSRAFYSVQANLDAEHALAEWLGVEDTLIFPSVTLANMGLLPALAGDHDLLVVDRLAHNSIHDGAKLARADGAQVARLSPCTAEKLSAILEKEPYERCVAAVDGVYSMSGASPPLVDLDQTVRAHGGVLYIDDAHGTGIFGAQGRGMAYRELGRLDNVLMVGSLSKAFSCLGAFVTCTSELKDYLKMKSNSYIFGGPVPPPYLEAIRVVCDILRSAEYDRLRARLDQLIQRLVQGTLRLGMTVLGRESPIVAILMQGKEKTLLAGKWLFDHGYYVQSVTFPAVPFNGGVLRIQVNANHSLEAVDGLLNALADLQKEMEFPAPQ